MRGTPWLVLLVLVACHDADEVVANLGEICGVEGPVRLLELEPDQTLVSPPVRIGERIFYDVGRPGSSSIHAPFVYFEDRQSWTTGLCGEAPTRLDSSYGSVFEVERWPGLPLTCDDQRNLVSLAPTGPLDPHIVFHRAGCEPLWSAQGPISMFSDELPMLLLQPYPDDPRRDTASAVVLLQAVATYAGGEPKIALAGDDLFALTPAAELVRIDLRARSLTIEQTGVVDFDVSPSGRYYLRAVRLPPNDPRVPGPEFVILTDRETGFDVLLGVPSAGGNSRILQWAEQGVVPFVLASGEQRIYRLPELEFVVLPAGYQLDRDILGRPGGPLADGRWVVRSWRDESLHLFDPVSGALDSLVPRPAQVLAHESGGALVLAAYPCCVFGRADAEGPVWFFPGDGGEPLRIADRSTMFGWRPRPDLLATLLDFGGDRLGTLALVEADTQLETVVDHRVSAALLRNDSEPDVIRYSVQHGARSGVWQVRLPAP